jgi:hypothetical protein
LADPGYQTQLKTLEEILDSGIEIGYTFIQNIYFDISSDLKHKGVAVRGEILSNDWECVDRFRETGNFVTFFFSLDCT